MMKILYVEDNTQDADLTRRHLTRYAPHISLEAVSTVAEARACLSRPGPGYDLALIDLLLPDGGGLDLLAEIREKALPTAVVIMTGLGDEQTAVAALKGGADDYLAKQDNYLSRLPMILTSALARFQAEKARKSRQVRVLYVERHSVDADLTRRHLARHAPHIRLEVIHSAEEAAQRLPASPDEPGPYDVLLLDYRLPGLNALELLKTLYDERRLDLPVVLVTGQGTEEVAVQALRLGATDYLVKHSGYLYELPAALENAYHRAQLAREQAALRESEARYRSLFENNHAIMLLIDPDNGEIIDANPAACTFYGWSRATLRSMSIGQINTLSPAEIHVEMQRARSEQRHHFYFKHRRADGSIRDVESYAGPIRLKGQNLLYSIIHDITERKQLEAENERLASQFFQAQKMEAIGQLAGGIAHDFNNLLVPILGYAEMSKMALSPGSSMYENMERISEAATRAANLTRQILAFSRKQVLALRVIDLNEIILDFNKMARHLIGEDIEIRMSLEPSLRKIKADPSQIEQILLNLVINARDAMPGGGKLTIETSNVYLDESYAAKHPDTEVGPYVMVAVSDTGMGMDPDTKKRLFEPFFTTKAMGKGTGLGLATVHGIVKQHGGSIWVYSEPGQGSTFKVYLPATEVANAADSNPAGHHIPAYGIETILVVEDDEMVRRLVCDMLESHGYRILESSDPEQALAQAAAHSEPIHLLLTDVVMPKMNGKELYQEIMAHHPEIQVLYMSGYADNAIIHHGVLDQGINYIQKPFAMRELAQKIRQVLS